MPHVQLQHWVLKARVCCLTFFPPPICVSDCLSLREWFLNGNYLIIIVSVCIILPLALMRQLGMFSLILLSHLCSVFLTFFTTRHNRSATTPICCCSPVFQVVAVLLAIGKTLWSSCYHSLPCRLPGLHQQFLPHLHGVLPHLGEPPKSWQKTQKNAQRVSGCANVDEPLWLCVVR